MIKELITIIKCTREVFIIGEKFEKGLLQYSRFLEEIKKVYKDFLIGIELELRKDLKEMNERITRIENLLNLGD